MDESTIWTNIIIPLLIGPFFIYLKSVYDNYIKNKHDHDLIKYNNKKDYLTQILNEFYWPLYLKLLCIHQLNYNIPVKNEFEYFSDSSIEENDIYNYNRCNHNGCNTIIPNSSKTCKTCKWNNDTNNIVININKNDILIDTNTIKLMETQLNNLFNEALTILETQLYVIRLTNKINKNVIQFIKYCKIRSIIHEGSVEKKYNIEYFGVKDNTDKLLSLIEADLLNYQRDYNNLIKNGPY